MSLLRFLGVGGAREQETTGDTATVRRIAAQLEHLDAETAKYLAAFAYVLARVAHADLEIDDAETKEMERAVCGLASLSEAEATLAVEIAKSQARLLGGTENYVVTREFANNSTREQREDVLRTAFAVGAADDSITAAESAELNQIGKELGFRADEVDAIRNEFRDQLAAIQAMRAARGA